MDRASIFVSHSAKDSEPAPSPADGPDAAQRWHRLCLARDLRAEIEVALRGLGTVDVWLDRRQLQPGDTWRDALHEELATCDGAVLLLTPEALESGWVLKEATILTWLHALGCPVRIVPVLVGVRPRDLVEHGFGPLGLDRIEARRVDADDLVAGDPAAVAEVAREVAENFRDVVARRTVTSLDLWAGKLAANWGDLDRMFLRQMMRLLRMGEATWPDGSFDRLSRPAHGIARELLLRHWREALTVLGTLTDLPVHWGGIKPLVLPLWIPAAAVAVLPRVAARPLGERVVLVNGTEPRTGQAVVRRAWFASVPGNRLLAPDDSGSTTEQVVAQMRAEVDATGVLDGDDITPEHPFFLVLGGGAATPDVVDALRRTPGLDAVTYVVMAGADRDALAGMSPAPSCLDPDLDPAGERDARIFARNLDMLTAG